MLTDELLKKQQVGVDGEKMRYVGDAFQEADSLHLNVPISIDFLRDKSTTQIHSSQELSLERFDISASIEAFTMDFKSSVVMSNS